MDRTFPIFANNARNIRFGLSTNGMNPFGEQSSGHSTWPVTLYIYNLPPCLCMKQKFIMMLVLIPGPKQHGNDIDVYLKPLIEDLLFCGKMRVFVCGMRTQRIILTYMHYFSYPPTIGQH